ncbi:2-methylcitrate dehydratase [Microvirga sp. KLBC 81]|uniref:bifunctional 2-methylcitrate dehydratase/aconitate hydratase n=1 Tax=Microvirga sp. KLBC 81 TaxID=1862707 RepID=UPI000D50AB85|nr:bifunctional 2-methylcitrate dehydratase/aconitate hydratase [Microvirga sp. KLBC 81]PVE20866.1 2-methylcitrate dehydratase [Microvirga sp. KLBC 81]
MDAQAPIQHRYDDVVEKIADYALSDTVFSQDAYDLAGYCLLDTIGCGVRSLQFPDCIRLLGPQVPGLEIKMGARVPGTNYRLDPVTAAFTIGVMNRWLEFNDTWLAAEWGHPSDNLGAILGLSDWLSREKLARGASTISMQEVLDSLIRAYEIQGVLCLQNAFNRLGIDHVIFVKIASTAISCRLLGLDKEQTLAAVSNAFIDGHALRTYRHAPNAGTRKSWAAGDATSRGVRLALISATGEMGYRQALTTPKWGFYDAMFGGAELRIPSPFGQMVIENILFKVPYPAEYHAQTAVEAAIKAHHILGSLGRAQSEIASVVVLTQRPAITIIDKKGPLNNAADRDHCMQYMVAVALLFGELKSIHFEDAFATDGRIDWLRTRIKCQENPDFTAAYYDVSKRSIGNTLQITLNDGSQIDDITIEYPIGHKHRRHEALPLLVEKFRENTQHVFCETRVEEMISTVLDVQVLAQLSVPAFMELFENSSFKRPDARLFG